MGRVERAVEARAAALQDEAFRAGYEAATAAGERQVPEVPRNPYAAGSQEAARWELGAEQADLEEGSPDSWPDGGAGMDRGVLRQVWAEEQEPEPDYCGDCGAPVLGHHGPCEVPAGDRGA